MNKTVKIILYSVVAIGLIAVVVWKLGENKAQMEATTQAAAVRLDGVPVVVEATATRELTDQLSADGHFAAAREVKVVSEAAGRLVRLNIENGTVVGHGSLIGELDSDLLRNQLALAEINLKKLKKDLERYQALLAGGGATATQVEGTELQIAQTENQMAALNKQIAMTRIVAPFGGTIMEKMVENGSFLSPGTPIATIVDVSRLKLNVKLTEAEVLRVRVGMPVRVTCPLYRDVNFTGVVRSVAVRADASMNYLVEIDVPNSPQNPLRAGMEGWAYFGDTQSNARTALAVRRDALVGGLQDPKVYVIQGGVARLRSIRTGLAAGNYVEVTQGLAPGDKVVVNGQINLVDSARVIISQ